MWYENQDTVEFTTLFIRNQEKNQKKYTHKHVVQNSRTDKLIFKEIRILATKRNIVFLS